MKKIFDKLKDISMSLGLRKNKFYSSVELYSRVKKKYINDNDSTKFRMIDNSEELMLLTDFNGVEKERLEIFYDIGDKEVREVIFLFDTISHYRNFEFTYVENINIYFVDGLKIEGGLEEFKIIYPDLYEKKEKILKEYYKTYIKKYESKQEETISPSF